MARHCFLRSAFPLIRAGNGHRDISANQQITLLCQQIKLLSTVPAVPYFRQHFTTRDVIPAKVQGKTYEGLHFLCVLSFLLWMFSDGEAAFITMTDILQIYKSAPYSCDSGWDPSHFWSQNQWWLSYVAPKGLSQRFSVYKASCTPRPFLCPPH